MIPLSTTLHATRVRVNKTCTVVYYTSKNDEFPFVFIKMLYTFKDNLIFKLSGVLNGT